MLSVGSREDARTGVGLGGSGGMEENELEEGEACSIQEDDANINPDIDLSYIDEKIQHILGHFQKDFEGGVSAENLGAKFGGYGSFLPAYQRSPSIWCHPRSPQRAPNNNAPSSPCNLPPEAANQDPTLSTSTSVSLKKGSVSKVPLSDGTKKNGTCISTPTLRECTAQNDLMNATSKSNDQNILKFRIKVGPDNVLPRPNASIYSDMGLEYSPSSSPEDSPGTSGGFSPELRDAPDESPMTIYQIMTCFPIPGGYILSPLPESLLHLMENERPYLRDSKLTIHKTALEAYDVLLGDSLSSRGVKISSGKKAKSAEKTVKPSRTKNVDGKGGVNDVIGIQKKEVDAETSAARELESNAPDISPQPNSKVIDERLETQLLAEAVKSGCMSREPNKVISKVRDISPDSAKNEPSVGLASLDTRKVSNAGNGFQHLKEKLNSRTGSSDMALEEGKTSKHKYGSSDPHMDYGVKSEKDAFKSEVDESKVRRDMIIGSDKSFEVKGPQESSLHEQNGEQILQLKDQSPGAKGKSGSQINAMPPVELPKENSKAVSSVPLKEKKKSSHSKIDRSENKRMFLGPNKEPSRLSSQECHKDAVGDTKSEHMGKRAEPMESTFRDKARDSRIENEKNAFSFAEKTKERMDGKKVQNPPVSEALEKNTESTQSMANGPMSDVAPAPSGQVLINEHWVCCDRCQKWRLLPYEANPDALPKKWLCSMQYWLLGLNKCNVSEEETTRALHALYQPPPPGNHTVNGPNSSSIGVSTDMQHVDQNPDPGLHMASSHGKKRHAQKDASNVPSHLAHLSQSVKKNQQASVKSRSLDDVNQVAPHSSSKSSFQNVSKLTELNAKKDNDRQREKPKMEELYSDGGEFLDQNSKPSKSKNRRDFDQDCRTPKKAKAEGILGADEDWHSDYDLSGKVASINNNGLPPKMSKKSSLKEDGNSSLKNSKCNSQDSLLGSRKKSKPHMQPTSNGLANFDEEKFNKESVSKKRKVKERQESRVHPETGLGISPLVHDKVTVTEELSESESRKEKRSRVLKAEGRDSAANKMDEKIDKKGRLTRVLLSNRREHLLDRMEEGNKGAAQVEQKGQCKGSVTSERNMESLDSQRRDLPSVHPPTAATSSSSKVSSTRKSKSNFQEAKGSPVESVSSSPLRISNSDKLANKKNQVGKNESKAFAVVHCRSLDPSQPIDSVVRDPAKAMPDYRDREETQMSLGEGKHRMHLKVCNNMHVDVFPSAFEENDLITGAVSTSAQHDKYPDDFRRNDCARDEEKPNNHCNSSGFTQRKSGKSSSSREKHKSSKSDVNKGKIKISDSFSQREGICSTKTGNCSRYDAEMDPHQRSTYHEDVRDMCNRSENKDEKKRESVGKQSSEGRRDNHLSFGMQENLEASNLPSKHHRGNHSKDSEVRTISANGGKSYAEDNPQKITSHEDDKSSSHFLAGRTEKLESTHGKGKSQPLTHSGDKQELPIRDPRTIPPIIKGDRPEASSADSVNIKASKVLRQPGKLDSQNGPHHSSLRHPTPNGIDAPSPLRRDSNHSAATAALKEARDLKHTANRLKNEGQENESTGLYFEAALKFLYVAFLLETESGKHGETTQSMAMYSDTARLCEFCAHEYERRKEMAAAALAYKCMEVAYMKVVFSKHSCASKDRHELHGALHMVPTGESPSSSASDVDNLNNQNTGEKATSGKGVSSPQVAGNHVIMARNRPNFVRLLNFVQDVNYAMEASRKSHCAFTAVSASPEELRCGPEIIASVRRVLDLSFHDVEGLLRLVRLSIHSISR